MKPVKTYSQFLNESKKQQFFTTKEEIEAWLRKQTDITGYVINDDLTVDATDVEIRRKMNYLPVRFGVVKNDFIVDGVGLKTLIGCPTYVGIGFFCDNNKLTSLEGCPTHIGNPGRFSCSGNQLTSLYGVPFKKQWTKFYCDDNKLTSFVFAPDELDGYQFNPCSDIYYKVGGFTEKAHSIALETLDPNPKDTLEKLKEVCPERYKNILDISKELRIIMGMEGEELQTAYNNSKTRGDDFY
jgi:hypothetical protein